MYCLFCYLEMSCSFLDHYACTRVLLSSPYRRIFFPISMEVGQGSVLMNSEVHDIVLFLSYLTITAKLLG